MVSRSIEETRSFEHYRLRYYDFFFFFFFEDKHSQGALIEIPTREFYRVSEIETAVERRLAPASLSLFPLGSRGQISRKLDEDICMSPLFPLDSSLATVPPRVSLLSLSLSLSLFLFLSLFLLSPFAALSSSRTTTFQAMRAAADASSWLEIVICVRSVSFY